MAARGQQWYVFDEQRVNKAKCQQEARDKSKVEPFTEQTVHMHAVGDVCDLFDRTKHHVYTNGAEVK
jgi:hypothetical protein